MPDYDYDVPIVLAVSLLSVYYIVFIVLNIIRKKYTPVRKRPMVFLIVWSFVSLTLIANLLRFSSYLPEKTEAGNLFGYAIRLLKIVHCSLISAHFARLYFIARVDQFRGEKRSYFEVDTMTNPSKASWSIFLMVWVLFSNIETSILLLGTAEHMKMHVAMMLDSIQTVSMFAILGFVLCTPVVKNYKDGNAIKKEVMYVALILLGAYFAQYIRYLDRLFNPDSGKGINTYMVQSFVHSFLHSAMFTVLVVIPTVKTFKK
jgi:hypothetical protein